MKEILETVIKNLVANPDAISVKEVEGEQTIIFEVRVDEGDMGKVIGKEGRVAKAIRTIMKAVASKEGKRVNVEFIG